MKRITLSKKWVSKLEEMDKELKHTSIMSPYEYLYHAHLTPEIGICLLFSTPILSAIWLLKPFRFDKLDTVETIRTVELRARCLDRPP